MTISQGNRVYLDDYITRALRHAIQNVFPSLEVTGMKVVHAMSVLKSTLMMSHVSLIMAATAY
jgi:hypothetical protein